MLRQKITPTEATEVRELFKACKNVVICTHTSPDGDAIGSSLALAEYFKRKGKNATIIVPNYFPDFLKWMNGADHIMLYDRQRGLANSFIGMADLICCLDFNSLSRIDELGDAVAHSRAKKLMIDHHLSPDKFCDVTISRPEASSTCELLFRVLDAIGATQHINLHCAEDIYAGMCTDTGGFTYNSNDPDIFLIISELMRKGIDKDLIYRKIYNNYTVDRYRLMGYILYEKLEVFPETHSSVFCMTKEELKRFHYLKGDAEGIVNMPLSIKGQKLSISLREDTEKPIVWVSLRSVDDFPCNRMAEDFFNGGGHLNAAGGRLSCSINEAAEIAKQAIEAYRDKLCNAQPES
ncbi:MAG: DHH family phosphoesterase [Bacteroides sp.]|nr:DHH family phosphoesterase [Roseburia sp.]MCM1346429.1 DHH family phosphoesterase [Bacteroides sp.]MCM1421908.1 DHH family phosphoesterase [Bacteroides sp.]